MERGQAVWIPKTGDPGVAGELVVARNPSGQVIAEFSKPPVPILVACTWMEGWAIEFSAGAHKYSGKGETRSRFGWLVLLEALQGKRLGDDWTWTPGKDGQWRLENLKSGERIEGFLAPESKAPPTGKPAPAAGRPGPASSAPNAASPPGSAQDVGSAGSRVSPGRPTPPHDFAQGWGASPGVMGT